MAIFADEEKELPVPLAEIMEPRLPIMGFCKAMLGASP